MIIRCPYCNWWGDYSDIVHDEEIIEDGEGVYDYEYWNVYRCPHCHREGLNAFDEEGKPVWGVFI